MFPSDGHACRTRLRRNKRTHAIGRIRLIRITWPLLISGLCIFNSVDVVVLTNVYSFELYWFLIDKFHHDTTVPNGPDVPSASPDGGGLSGSSITRAFDGQMSVCYVFGVARRFYEARNTSERRLASCEIHARCQNIVSDMFVWYDICWHHTIRDIPNWRICLWTGYFHLCFGEIVWRWLAVKDNIVWYSLILNFKKKWILGYNWRCHSEFKTSEAQSVS